MNVGVSAGSHQRWQSSEEESVSFEESVRIAPGAKGTISGFVDWAGDAEAPFVLTLRVSARLGGNKIPGAEIAKVLQAIQPDLAIAATNTTDVLVQLSGRFLGAYGLQTSTTITPAVGPAPVVEARSAVRTAFAA